MSAIRRAASIVLASAAGLSACGQQSYTPPPGRPAFPPVTHVITPIDVTRIDLGTATRPDGTISAQTTLFKPTDTIIAAVTTERPAHDVKLTARWVYSETSQIKETTQVISPSNILVTDFQISNGAGWPPGQYKLTMLVNGTPVAVTTFAVIH